MRPCTRAYDAKVQSIERHNSVEKLLDFEIAAFFRHLHCEAPTLGGKGQTVGNGPCPLTLVSYEYRNLRRHR